MLASSTGHARKFMLPLLTKCQYHHCLVFPKPLSRIDRPSITDKCHVRIKTFFFNPLPENSRKTSTTSASVSNFSLLKCYPGPSSRQLPPAHMSSPATFWKSFHCRQASTDSAKDEDKFRIIMATTVLKELKHAPTPPLVLGISGLIPFVSFPIYMFMSNVYMPHLALAQATYGAVILSFLGGIRWGTAIAYNSIIKPDWNNLTQAVVPSLVGWSAIQLSCPASTLVLAGGFACLAYYDMAFSPYLPWFRALRLFLSGIAVLALFSDLLCYLILASSADKAKQKKQNC